MTTTVKKTKWMSKARLVNLCEALSACSRGLDWLEAAKGRNVKELFGQAGAGDWIDWLMIETGIRGPRPSSCALFGCAICGIRKATPARRLTWAKRLNNACFRTARELGI